MLNVKCTQAFRVHRFPILVGLTLAALAMGAIHPHAFFTHSIADAQEPVGSVASSPAGNTASDMIQAEYQQYSWKRNDPPRRMISKDEGFCFLGEVGGHFAGGGEAVSVYIGEDGFWYLGGRSGQDIFAKAYSVKFSRKMVASVVPPPDPAAEAWRQTLANIAGGANDSLKSLAVQESTAFPAEPGDVLKLAELWNDAVSKAPDDQRPLIQSHLLHLYEVTLGRLSGAKLEQARARLQQLRLALGTQRLNEFGSWTARKGQWSVTPQGAIEGNGDSDLVLENALPPDCLVEFHANAVEGMRTRIHFPGTSIYIGNEGFTHRMDVYGGETRRTVPHPYSNGEDMKLGMKFVGKNFEFYVNGELQGKGTRSATSNALGIRLSSGDDFDKGITRFWDFKVSAVR